MCCDYKAFHNICSLSLTESVAIVPSWNKKQLSFFSPWMEDSQQMDSEITSFLPFSFPRLTVRHLLRNFAQLALSYKGLYP